MFFKDQVGSRLRTPGLRQLGPTHLQCWLPRKQAHEPNYGLFLQGQGCMVTPTLPNNPVRLLLLLLLLPPLLDLEATVKRGHRLAPGHTERKRGSQE